MLYFYFSALCQNHQTLNLCLLQLYFELLEFDYTLEFLNVFFVNYLLGLGRLSFLTVLSSTLPGQPGLWRHLKKWKKNSLNDI